MFPTSLSAGSGPDPNYKFISVFTHVVLVSAFSKPPAHVFGAVLNCRLPTSNLQFETAPKTCADDFEVGRYEIYEGTEGL